MPLNYFKKSFILILVTSIILLFVYLDLMPKIARFIEADAKSVVASQTNYYQLKIVMPFYINQLNSILDNVKTWNKYKPCENNAKTRVELVFYVGYFEANLTDLYAKLPQSIDCFCKTSIALYKYMTQNEDKHVSGSRLMFESMLNKSYESFNNTSFVFYMEPDVRPIRSGWLNSIIQEIGAGHFWLKGSIFRGDVSKFAENDSYYPNYVHINGNAIYNIGNTDLASFYFGKLRPYVIKANGDSKNAYDTDFFEFLLDKNNYNVTRHILHQFHFTELIQNYWHTKYNVTEMADKFKLTFFVHGGFPIY